MVLAMSCEYSRIYNLSKVVSYQVCQSVWKTSVLKCRQLTDIFWNTYMTFGLFGALSLSKSAIREPLPSDHELNAFSLKTHYLW